MFKEIKQNEEALYLIIVVNWEYFDFNEQLDYNRLMFKTETLTDKDLKYLSG